jgi:urease accessory protein
MPLQVDGAVGLTEGGRKMRVSALRAVAGWSGERPALLSRFHSSPLKIAKSFTWHEEDRCQLAVLQMDVSPGMLEGDCYEIDWTVQAGVAAYVTNQAYTRVHPCGDGRACLIQRLRLESDASLEWMPEPVMLFRDARFVQDTRIDLAPGAVFMMGDIVSPGRLSRGERFAYAEYDARLEVRLSERLVHCQRLRWVPSELPVKAPGCFGTYSHQASFSVFGDRIRPAHLAGIREMLEQEGDGLGDVVWGASLTAQCGLTVQAAGDAAWSLQRFVLRAWDAARRQVLDLPPMRLLKEAWMD